MKITLIAVGKIKERYFEDAIREYSKRLSRYCRLEIIQVADEKTPDGASEALEEQIKEKEGRRILDQIREGAYVIALAVEGKQLDSLELAARMERLAVEADSALLSKAVENILSNAFLYSPEGARIRVWCGLIQDQPAFAVENSGVHIPEEALPHLFEAFYRIESSRSRSTGGSGLGLCLTKMILDRHKASCTVKNTEGGVQVLVRFPASSCLHTKHI